jgi:uncharacterized protein YozE (UPF0346 family)
LKILNDGRLALGIMLGVTTTLIAVLFFAERWSIVDEVRYGLIGTFVAAVIGAASQVLIYVFQRADSEELKRAELINKLQRVFSKALKSVSIFAGIQHMIESNNSIDNVIFEKGPSLVKPLFGSDYLPKITEEDYETAFRIMDAELLHNLKDLDELWENYRRIFPIYTEKFQELTGALAEDVRFDGGTGYSEGRTKHGPELFFIRDLQQSIILLTLHSDSINIRRVILYL